MTCSLVIVSGRRRPNGASSSLVQASAATTTVRARCVTPPATSSTSPPTSRREVTGVRSSSVAPWACGQAAVRGVALERVGEAALRLEHRGRALVEPPLRPAAHHLVGVEQLERDVLRRQALGVVGLGDRGVRRPQVQAAGDRHDPLAGLGLDLRPGLVGALGEPDVVGAVVREPDDPAVVGRRAVGMTELELLEPEDAGAGVGRGPVGGAGAERAEADDDQVPLAAVGGHRPMVGGRSRRGPDRSAYRPDRSSATRWIASTLIASVIRPSSVIARASSNGTQRTSSTSLGSGDAGPWRQAGRQVEERDLVGDRVRELDAGELAPLGRLEAGLLAELALRAVERVLAVRHAALRDLPRVAVERVAVLPDQDDPVLVVDRDDAGGDVREVDDAVDPGAAVRARSTSSCQTVSHGFS